MREWIENEFADELPEIEVGDIVHFKVHDGFDYFVKAECIALGDQTLDAEVEAVFDGEGGEPGGQINVSQHRIEELAGETLVMGYEFVHAVYEP
ncbi:hypothetical protein [Neptunomonas concharum]|uniref:Uncharacterized protein n=1 Tax=Neptunomonas concharum TaxID=1031538 RepID=A0A5P1RDS1_9GAMM|nr:hypothetical protein [Neptunomonas concharum]QEQ97421.1 hypothetical protein F0U83_12235 [Neptunomonas concharum]